MNSADKNLQINASNCHINKKSYTVSTINAVTADKLYAYHQKPSAKVKFTPSKAQIGPIQRHPAIRKSDA